MESQQKRSKPTKEVSQKASTPVDNSSVAAAQSKKKPAAPAKQTTSKKPAPKKKQAPKRPPGRPSDYSVETTDYICGQLAEGKSLRAICQADNMPDKGTVLRWLGQHEEFRIQYARARELQAECMFDDMLEIIDDGRNDTYIDENGNPRVDTDVIQRSKLRFEGRKWMAGKLKPKVYGDKVDVNHGVQPDNPITSLLAAVAGTSFKPKSNPDD